MSVSRFHVYDKSSLRISWKLNYCALHRASRTNQGICISEASEEILKVSKRYKAKTIIRPKKYATDYATSESALLHFASKINFDILVFLQPTSPLVKSHDINKAINAFQKIGKKNQII